MCSKTYQFIDSMDGRLNEFGVCWIVELDVLIKSREEALKREIKL